MRNTSDMTRGVQSHVKQLLTCMPRSREKLKVSIQAVTLSPLLNDDLEELMKEKSANHENYLRGGLVVCADMS